MDPIIIENAFEERQHLTAANAPALLKTAIHDVIHALNQGTLRVAEVKDNTWQVNTWVKKAVLLYFKLYESQRIDAGFTQFYDKVPLKYEHYSAADFLKDKVRVVPHAIVRQGAYIGPNTVLMPSYVNIGAYVGEGTLVDTWATVGSCAQIGRHVHLSGGVGIGGVLEPLQASPTIIEDHCFIGARSEIVEGVIVEKNSVISMGVYIGQSTKIYDRETDEILYGRVPEGSVVVPGTLPDKFGRCQLYAAIIVKKITAETRAKVSLNELLRTP